MILSGMKTSEKFSPDKSVHECCRLITEALKNGGNILFPVYPCGIAFDLLEIVIGKFSVFKIQNIFRIWKHIFKQRKNEDLWLIFRKSNS